MDIKKLQSVVIDALEDVKAQDIRAFDTVHLTSMFDRMAIASGTSNRQTKALAASVRDKVKENGGTIVSIEGEDTGEWVLVDLGDMVVHIMQPAIRDYYRLEEIWGEKEIKLGAAKRGVSKRAVSGDGEDKPARKTSRHLAASQALDDDEVPKKPARKTAAKKSATSTKQSTGAKVPAGKKVKVAAPKSTTTAKKTAAKSATAAKKAPAKRATAARKTAKTAE
jgi:ribosome-associated protein